MKNYSMAIVEGRLVRDPDAKHTKSGQIVVLFTVACSDQYKDKETTSFIQCEAWSYTGEFVSKYLRKGSPVLVAGRLIQQSWKDDQGNYKERIFIRADTVRSFQSGKRAENEPSSYNPADDDMPF